MSSALLDKLLFWVCSSPKDLRDLSEEVKDEVGFVLIRCRGAHTVVR